MILPAHICFRVTRNCNARCVFCLAPPDGCDPDEAELKLRLDWLLARGVRSIQFCGGEPTVHPAFPQLLAYSSSRGAKTSLCTNALEIAGALLPLLVGTGTRVRVSLHGDRAHHDTLVGTGAFERTTANLRRLVRAGVPTSLQTTVVADGRAALDWAIGFALEQGVKRLGVVPFLPRGRGADRRGELALSQKDRHVLRGVVRTKRRELAGQLDLRYLDFAAKSLAVVEPDGRLIEEGATEATDKVICRIP